MKVTVIKQGHEHAGKPVKVGESLDVDQATATWLAELGVIAPLAGAAPAAAPAAPTTPTADAKAVKGASEHRS